MLELIQILSCDVMLEYHVNVVLQYIVLHKTLSRKALYNILTS